MRTLYFVVFLSLSWTALAGDESGSHENTPKDNVSRERLEKRLRTLRIVELSEQLNLSTGQAVRLDEILRNFDERRRPYQRQMGEFSKLLKTASEGDASATLQVDDAISQIFDLRLQLLQLDRELIGALSKELTAQQRAKLAIVFGSLREQMRQEIQKMRPAEARRSPEK